ncbi:MAG: hypothetical protein ACKO2P_03505 [Planctomycetota bacterium]
MTVSRFVFQFVLVLITGWLIAFWPAAFLNPVSGVFWLTVAAGVMFFSGISGIVLVSVLKQHNTLAEIFLHSGNRAFWVLVAAGIAKTSQPQLGFSDFYGWLIFFYLQLMVLEVLSLRRHTQSRGS